MEMDNEADTIARARYKGWRIWKGPSVTGQPIDIAYCPDCAKSHRPARKEPELANQLDLFAEDGS